MTNNELSASAGFVIGVWSFLRHTCFVIRHCPKRVWQPTLIHYNGVGQSPLTPKPHDAMFPFPKKKFKHPGGVFRLDYPAHWDQAQQDHAKSCGFGPHDRDNVGLWISIMPMSLDTERMEEDLPRLMMESLPKDQARDVRRDETMQHYSLKADIVKENEGGHYWIVAGGDVILFASTQVPIGERETWNPLFEGVMASLVITREEELFRRQLTNEVLEVLREKHPDENFKLDEEGIRGDHQVVFMSNLHREVQAAPKRRKEIIRHFVDSLAKSSHEDMGHETWADSQPNILPLLKPRDYVDPERATRHVLTSEWVGDVVICYAIRNKNLYRFITQWDLDRWETDLNALHTLAITNVSKLSWPKKIEGSRQADGGRVIVLDTNDSLASTRLLHPELHHLFSQPLGSPFWAGIPDRNTLVLFSDRRKLRQRIERRLKADHHTAAYPISARPFLVTADGIAAIPTKGKGSKEE